MDTPIGGMSSFRLHSGCTGVVPAGILIPVFVLRGMVIVIVCEAKKRTRWEWAKIVAKPIPGTLAKVAKIKTPCFTAQNSANLAHLSSRHQFVPYGCAAKRFYLNFSCDQVS